MAKVAVYEADGGEMAIVWPTPEALAAFGIEAIALKDVPKGKAFSIIEDSDVPEDRSTWVLPLKDGKGADYGVGSSKTVIGWTDVGEPIIEGGK